MAGLSIDPAGGVSPSDRVGTHGLGGIERVNADNSASGGNMTPIIAFFIEMADKIAGHLVPLMGAGELLNGLLNGADALLNALQDPSSLTGGEASTILNFLTFLDNLSQSPVFSDLSSGTQTAITNLIDNTGIQTLQADLLSLYNYEDQNGLLNEPESQWTTTQTNTVDSMISGIQGDLTNIQNSSSYAQLHTGLTNAVLALQTSITEWMAQVKLEMGKMVPLFEIPTNVINQTTQQESGEASRITS